MISLSDFEGYAMEHLPKKTKDFFAGGACGEFSQRNNEAAFQRLRLLPRVLRDVTHVATDTSILGDRISVPIGISPTAFQKMVHPDGEIAMVKASKSMGTCMVVSTYATCSIEEVVAAAPDSLRWFQLYVVTDRDFTRQLVLRAEAAGYKALVVTVDTHVVGTRYASIRNQFEVSPHLKVVNIESLLPTFNSIINECAVTWKDIDWLQSQTKMPIVLKGILTVEDAREAVQHGIAGIWVSNHGGRQLDTVPATIEVLPEIAKEVGDKAEIYVDGGVRFGTDVLKAIALGARAVFVGRPPLWGLTYNGEDGARQVLQILSDEFKTAMTLSGCATIGDITRSLVVHQSQFAKL